MDEDDLFDFYDDEVSMEEYAENFWPAGIPMAGEEGLPMDEWSGYDG